MEVLYLSALASQSVITKAHRVYPHFSGYAVQKFSRLIAEGCASNGVEVTALSSFYIPSVGRIWHHRSEFDKGVVYKYIPSISFFRSIRHIWLVVYCFLYVFFWGLYNKKDKAIICDVLNVSSCMGAVAASRLTGLRRVAIVTDLPGMVPGRTLKDCVESKQMRICMTYIRHCTHFVLLTRQMNDIVNPMNRPYLIMEGLVDANIKHNDTIVPKDPKRIALYAGGLKEGYGLRLLVEGFIKADVKDSELWVYGYGPFVEDLHKYELNDSRVKYLGIRPNAEIVDAEKRATLLINPRPTYEEITCYSFPSKNMEYMVSGTPLLTTVLPGMPEEYHNYVYLFNQGETVDGYSDVIKRVLSLPDEDLKQKGKDARLWVLENKNNIKQAGRIISFINN